MIVPWLVLYAVCGVVLLLCCVSTEQGQRDVRIDSALWIVFLWPIILLDLIFDAADY